MVDLQVIVQSDCTVYGHLHPFTVHNKQFCADGVQKTLFSDRTILDLQKPIPDWHLLITGHCAVLLLPTAKIFC